MENKQMPKQKFRLNIFDVVIIAIIVLAAVVFLVWKYGSSSVLPTSDEQLLHYTIEITTLSEETGALIQVGDVVKDNAKNYAMGTVTNIDLVPATKLVPDYNNGCYVEAEIPNQVDAILELEAVAVESASSFTVDGGFVVRAGTAIAVAGPGYAGTGYILKVERTGE